MLLCGVEHSFLSLFADDVVLPPPSILRTKLLRPVSPFITDIPKRFLEIFNFWNEHFSFRHARILYSKFYSHVLTTLIFNIINLTHWWSSMIHLMIHCWSVQLMIFNFFIPITISNPDFFFVDPQTPVAQKVVDDVVFRRFKGEGFEFFWIGPLWPPSDFWCASFGKNQFKPFQLSFFSGFLYQDLLIQTNEKKRGLFTLASL